MNLLRMDPEVEEILEKALKGERINEDEALTLMNSSRDNLLAVALAANKICENKVGRVATYVVNRNINFTNICIGGCKFCAFRRAPEDKDAYFLNISSIVEKAVEAKMFGATEVCIQGGLHPKLDIHFYANVLAAIKDKVNIHIHAFSPMEIHYASQKSGMSIRETLKCLKESGLDSMPGTAAEILDDEIRNIICPKKIKTQEWTEIIKEAHKLGIPTTATMLYGHVETPEARIRHLKILRDIQDETQSFTEFVPLSFVHFNAPLFLSKLSKAGATGTEDLKVLAVSRIFLDNFKNIQASWVKLGRKFAQFMLNCGANDLGGTLIEENISHSAGLHVEMLTPPELERMIIEAGKIPKQRDTLYNLTALQVWKD